LDSRFSALICARASFRVRPVADLGTDVRRGVPAIVVLFWALSTAAIVSACSRDETLRPDAGGTSPSSAPLLSEEQARQVAQRDAKDAYGDLSKCSAVARLDGAVWHVDYVYVGKGVGGCPAYVVDARSGQILSKEYSQ
jgi:hypothetical protein